MKKQNNKNILFLVLIIIAGASFFVFTSGLLSIIDLEKKPSCEISIEGGSCDFYLELPSGSMLKDGYAFNIRTKALPEDEFKDRQRIVMSGQVGPLTREGNFNFYQKENHYMYLFNVPDWLDVYEYKFEYELENIVSLRTNTEDTRADAIFRLATIPNQYAFSEPIICASESLAWCRENVPNFLIRNTITDSGTRVFWYYNDNVAYKETTDLSISGNSFEEKKFSGEVIIKGHELPDIYRKIAVKNEIEIQDRGSMTLRNNPTITNFPQVPIIYASYRENHQITNMKVYIGEELYFKEDGIIDEGKTYLPDMSKFVNEYCGRLDDVPNNNHCVVKMTFQSDRGGVIEITDIVGDLKVNREPIFSSEKFNLFPLIITILVIIIIVLFYFVVRNKK